MGHLDKYLLRNFFVKFGLTLMSLLVIIIIVDVIDHLNKFIDAKIPQIEIIHYYFYNFPWFISIGIPISCLLATIFSLGLLNKQNEITALKSSGISIYRIGMPLILSGFIISVFSFFFDNFIVTNSLNQKSEIEKKYFFKRSSKTKGSSRDIYRQISESRILSIQKFSHKKNEAKRVSILNYGEGNLISRFDTPYMIWDPQESAWKVSNYSQRFWDESDEISFLKEEKDSLIHLSFTPLDLTRELMKPDEMNFWDLAKFVRKLKKNSIHEPRWEVSFYFKTAFAGTSFLMVLLGIPLAIRKPRSNLAIGIGVSVFFIFLYYASLKFGQSLGISGQVSPFLSVWSVNFIFLGIGCYMLFKTRT